jgi:colanic acid/amylovoran biosynthesis glycosyltransferase
MSQKLLLVLPLQAYRNGPLVFIDAQARNGLRLWLDHFDLLTLACPTYDGHPPIDFLPIDDPRVRLISLPAAFTPYSFLVALIKMRSVLGKTIDENDYLHFAIGGLFGDWGSVSALIARKKGRPFAVWTDRVESQVVAFQASSKRGLRKFYHATMAVLIKLYERQIIRRSALGLFHGMECYEAYSPYSSNPHLVHDIHLGRESRICDADIADRFRYTGPIRIAYAGRAHCDKGIYDWIETLSRAVKSGIALNAVWFGDGPELVNARNAVARQNLSQSIHFVGKVDHRTLIEKLRSFDLFLFCHKTRESPRCLIEALICGLPIIGYDSPYPRDLIKENCGGILVPANDPASLIATIDGFKKERATLTQKARLDGGLFDADGVFQKRSYLMKTLAPVTPKALP